MGVLKEIIHKTSDGEPAEVTWSHLRPLLPGDTDRQRWLALWRWTRDSRLFYAASDLTVGPSGEIASANVVFWADVP
jgi:hypothetical protein